MTNVEDADPAEVSTSLALISIFTILLTWIAMLVAMFYYGFTLTKVFDDFGMELPVGTTTALKLIHFAFFTKRFWLVPLGSSVVGLTMFEVYWRASSRKRIRWPLWSTLLPISIGLCFGSQLLLPLLRLVRELG